ncbi:MAG: polysaccharide deacetylase family protein, partial [Bacteroidales bacterium]|nr:polysaccharide deacetylase family protein [Bacteroidales bacterium]
QDEHGRFAVEKSLAYRGNFLQIPLVDMMAHEIKKLLQDRYPGIEIPGQPFRFIPSFDIDIAYAHLAKGWGRAVAAWVKLLLKADIEQVKERLATLSGNVKDPYDNFDLHAKWAGKYGHPLLYFILLGNFSKFDRNTSHKNRRFRKLIHDLGRYSEVGIHPSYRSHLCPEIFEEEKRRLEDIILKPVTRNRFHFLRLKFPESCRLLISQGITEDYSLGYSTINGFRASTCTPFLFYDLQKEEVTTLRLHPFIFMDSAIIDHMKLTPQQAISAITGLVDQVKKYGGEAIGIWHNYSLSEKDQYTGWQVVLESILEKYQNTSP